ncbi:MAG: DNA methyltransferase [Roseiarcus sp.]
MNAVEIEEAVSELAAAPFDAAEFPYAFLAAFGNKDTTIKRLRAGSSNASDVPGGVLQRNNIHLAVCAPGAVGATLTALRESPKRASAKAKFVLATDGAELQAEEIASGDLIVCPYPEVAKHFGFFLPLAGISTVKQIAHNPIDIKATGRLNKLYVELLKDNPDWGTDARRHDLNQFMARLIFCFFAESTGIFRPHLFTDTIRQMSDPQSANTHEVISELFRVMDTKRELRKAADFRPWAEQFPYVNGSLFAGRTDCPRFSRIARAYLLRAGELDWKGINPDIFGSMIQAVADDDERGSLGLHYTSVPNILKVLDPLFLDDLRAQLEAAGDNVRKLKNLRRRIASIRVFDPACGSGNFLVIAYIKMREIEFEIMRRLGEGRGTQIKLENFYGIEIKSFPVEIARLSLLIAEFQCNVRLFGEEEAWLNVLPLHKTGQIQVGNALRMDWLKLCPPAAPILEEFDLAGPTGRLALDESGIGGGAEPETYICGNPPYKGSQSQSDEQKADLIATFSGRLAAVGSTDYVAGWFIRARDYMDATASKSAFVTTNSLNQGRQVATLWPLLLGRHTRILFARRSFKWSNLAAQKAGVTVSIVCFGKPDASARYLISELERQAVDNISPYLVGGPTIYVESRSKALANLPPMNFGSMPNDGGALLMSRERADMAKREYSVPQSFIRPVAGSREFIDGIERRCIWVTDADYRTAAKNHWLAARFRQAAAARSKSKRATTTNLASHPYRFGEVRQSGDERPIIVPSVSSEEREYLPVGLLPRGSIVTNLAFALYDAALWNLALIASRLHLVWIATVCGKLETRYRYSNTLGWNTFPVPTLTEQNKADLTRCAEDILLAREAHFPATIADLYDPEAMPDDLRRAHERNDETLERIYIGRRFRNDTERLEKLFDMYTKMTEGEAPKAEAAKKGKATA